MYSDIVHLSFLHIGRINYKNYECYIYILIDSQSKKTITTINRDFIVFNLNDTIPDNYKTI